MQLSASSFDFSLRFATSESPFRDILASSCSGQTPAPFLAGFHNSSCLGHTIYLPAVLLGSLSACVVSLSSSVNPFLNLHLTKPSSITAKEQLKSNLLPFTVHVCS